jgi:hypothetical protein
MPQMQFGPVMARTMIEDACGVKGSGGMCSRLGDQE